MAFNGSFPGKDEVAKMLLDALRQDKKDVVINAEIQAEIDQPSFKAAEQQINKLTKTKKVDIDTSKAEQKIKNLMEPLREVEREIKALGSSGADFNVAHNTIKKYEQLKLAVSEATKAIGRNNQELLEAKKIIKNVDDAIKGLDITVEKATKKKRTRQTKKTSDDIKAQTEAIVEQTAAVEHETSATVKHSEVVADDIQKTKERIEVQKQHIQSTEAAARAQEKLNKAEEKSLKLKPRKDNDGKRIAGAYATEDGLFEVDHDADGWKVHRKNAAGLYELVKIAKTKNEIMQDSALIAEQEAYAQKKASHVVTDSQKKIEQELLSLSDAYEEMAKRAVHSAKFAEQYGAIFKAVQGGALSAAEAIAQLNVEIAKMNNANTPNMVTDVASSVKAQEQQMKKAVELIGELYNKYGDKFNDIFGSIGEVSAENAVAVYDMLINKEKEYRDAVSKRVTALNEFAHDANNNFQDVAHLEEYQKQFTNLAQQIIDGKIGIDEAKQSLTEFSQTLVQVARSDDQNKGLISSYKDLYRELEKLVDLSKQLKPGYTSEYEEMSQLTDNIGYVNNKEEAIAEIKAWYENIKRIKSSLKNGLSVYKHVSGDGYEYEDAASEQSLAKADATLRGYIVSAVANFGYTLAEAMDDFPKKRMRYFVEDQINKYYEIDARNSAYSADADAFNAPIQEQIDAITTSISNMATSIDNMAKATDVLFDLTSRSKDVNRYTLSTEANKIGSLIGVQTPYDEIRANAKRIESYEELCGVVARYNELRGDAVVYGGKDYPGFDANAEQEYRELLARLRLTAGDDVFGKFRLDTPKDIDNLASAIGIKIPNATKQASSSLNGLQSQIFGALQQIRELYNQLRDSDYSDDSVTQKMETMRTINSAISDIERKQFPYISKAFRDESFNPNDVGIDWATTDEELREMAESIAVYATVSKEELGELKLIKIDTSSVESFNGELKNICDNAGNAVEAYRGLANEAQSNKLLTLGHHSGATWFSTQKDVARGYTRGTNNLYRANLQASRLLDIDANHSGWNDITFLGDGSDDISKKITELYNKKKELKEETVRLAEANQTESQSYKETNAALRRVTADYEYYSKRMDTPYGTHDTNWYAEYAKANGYDAFRIRNVYDTLQGGGMSDVIGVFSNEQILNIEKVVDALHEDMVPAIEDASKKEHSFANAAEEVNKQLEQQADISNLVSRDIINRALNGVDVDGLLSSYGLKGDDLTHGVDLFKDLAGARYLGDTAPKSADEIFAELVDFVTESAQSSNPITKIMPKFREYMKNIQVRIPTDMEESFAAEFKDEWKDIRKLYTFVEKGEKKKKLLTKSKYASTPDVLLDNLLENNLGYTLDQEMLQNYAGNQFDALKMIVDAVRRARAEFNLPSTQTIFGLNEEETVDFLNRATFAIDAVDKNIEVMRTEMAKASASGNEFADSVERAADATERQVSAQNALTSNGQTNLFGGSDDDGANAEEKVKIIQKTVDAALEQLRNAKDNKNLMIDLSNVVSAGDLQDQIGNLVANALGADLHVGGVVVAEDIAQIKLYNKELGITTQQVWRLKGATEGAAEANLEFVKADPLRVDFQKAQQYAEARQKSIDDAEKWLISATKRLNDQKRNYQNSQKKIAGSTPLLDIDATTLKSDSEKTIDDLADHIQNLIDENIGKRISGSIKNQITQNLNALENEVKIQQLEKYTNTTLSASEADAARKVILNTIDSIAENAKKKNVFDQIKDSYDKLRARLTDSGRDDYISTNFTEAINAMRVLRADMSKVSAEESNLQSLLALQEKLYNAKKKTAEFEAKGQLATSDGMAASRKTAELEEQYNTSVKLLENEKQRVTVTERQAQLEAELKTFKQEQQKSKFEQDVKNSEKEQTASIRDQYKEILDLVNKINTANERMIRFQSMDGGSGVLGSQIAAEQAKKLEAVEKLNVAMEKLETTGVLGSDRYNLPDDVKSIGADYAQIAAFINDAGVQASLTTGEIEKLVNALVKAGDIDLSMFESALGSSNLRERAQQAAKEMRYFADKTRYTGDLDIDQITNVGAAAEDTKTKLENMAQSIAKNSDGAAAMIQGFSQSADGISRLDFSVFDTATNSLRSFRIEMGSVTDGVYVTETTINESLANIQNAQKQLQSIGDLIGRLGASGVSVAADSAPTQVGQLLQTYKALSAELAKGDNANQDMISTLSQKAKLAKAEVEKLYRQMLQMESAIENGQMTGVGIGDPTGDVYGQLAQKAREFATTQPGATLELGRFDKATNTLNASLVYANGTVEEFKFQMNGLSGQMAQQQGGVKKLATNWDKFKASIASVGRQLMTAVVGYNIFFKAISEVRKGINYVKQIDLALTELKKVTDETEASYEKFLQTAADTAGQIGSTVSDFTEASANFARLGYTMSESADMAKTAIVYKNVADGLDTVEAATESIISTMKAFGIESQDTMGIIDRFNEVKFLASLYSNVYDKDGYIGKTLDTDNSEERF